jgi:ABC-2 type transport system permease protein
MNRVLFGHAWRDQAGKLLVVLVGLMIWGFLLPVIYASFGVQFKQLAQSGVLPAQLSEFGGGDVFSLSGAIALGFVHPISVAMISIFAVGFAASAVAGERQRGSLEVLMARPLSRREVYLTLLVTTWAFLGVVIAGQILGSAIGATAFGVASELVWPNMALLWLNGLLLYVTFSAIGLAASVSFDRLTPALGITFGVVVVQYFMDILGSLWPDAKGIQPFSLFHYLQAKAVLTGNLEPGNVAVLLAVTAVAVVFALVEFPRRDLAAPS